MEHFSLKEKLIICMEEHENLTFNDISVFFDKSTKSDNDRTNKLREVIIQHILNKKIPKNWYSSPQWFKVALRLKEFLKYFDGDLKEVQIKAGRNYNYDFDFIFEDHVEKIEFKNGVKSINIYPEILSVSSNTFVKGLSYPEFFYDFYLPELTNHELPSKEYYLKNIHKSSVNHPFFIHLKEVDDFKVTVDKSINDYLQNFLDFDFDVFKEKMKHQLDKKFMLWENEQFYLDTLTQEDLDIIHEKHLKKGRNGYNTLVIKTKGKTEYHLLLRWKNHAGVLFPAWQIKLKRN
jgi:hypothetical protein